MNSHLDPAPLLLAAATLRTVDPVQRTVDPSLVCGTGPAYRTDGAHLDQYDGIHLDRPARPSYPAPVKATAFTETPSGLVAWSGVSLLDGRTLIDVILTGLKGLSGNQKTGKTIQAWIIRHDKDPRDAVAEGTELGICGDCKHRPRCEDCDRTGPYFHGARCEDCGGRMVRACYVKVFHGPTTAYKVRHGLKGPWARNPWYPMATPADLEQIRAKGAVIRFGAYGDPAAVPARVWETLSGACPRWLGYTHAWRTCDPALRAYCMASVDSPAEYAEAVAAGWRTFRVRGKDQPLIKGEIACPASAEAGKVAVCADCSLCMGTSRKAKQIAIIAHGMGAGAFKG